jgi:hypothetical protein
MYHFDEGVATKLATVWNDVVMLVGVVQEAGARTGRRIESNETGDPDATQGIFRKTMISSVRGAANARPYPRSFFIVGQI